jgi:hypothetical protein
MAITTVKQESMFSSEDLCDAIRASGMMKAECLLLGWASMHVSISTKER